VRRLYRPFVSQYVALSAELARQLEGGVRVHKDRISQFYNGVDSEKFTPAPGAPAAILGSPFSPGEHWILGTVGRMQAVKDQRTLAQAFVRALELAPALRGRLRLVMVGDGPLRAEVQQLLDAAGVGGLSWLPGERHDVADILRGLHCFVLPSQSEGISNVILEAMASGLPVLATAVGGNTELVRAGHTGELVPAQDADAMARAVIALASDPARCAAMGRTARADALARFSMQAMVASYQGLYDRLLGRPTVH
jgi:sugar transferase (PEP-CTERM/EpsH1 system associated)